MKYNFTPTLGLRSALALGWLALLSPVGAMAQQTPRYPVTAEQRGMATQVAQAGVALTELAPDAPEEYTVRRGDTLWGVSRQFLRSPWRWPALWGMNLQEIRNPHLIYPGQQLYLDRTGGQARLRLRGSQDGGVGATVRVSPRNRSELLGGGPLPTLQPHLIEPFLSEPLVVDDDSFERAPRIVATNSERRVLLAKGDRAYARGPKDAPMLLAPGLPTKFRIFRNATPLKDPVTGEILGYEGQYMGSAELVRGESEIEEAPETRLAPPPASHAMPAPGEHVPEPVITSRPEALPVPATISILSNKEEMRTGDRLLPEPPRDFRNYTPHAPNVPVDARVVSVYGSAVRYAAQNQVVVINKGLRDGIEKGHVLSLLSTGARILDKSVQERGELIKLPDERNGVALVFLPFERVSYALVMEIEDPVQVGDKLVNPR
ncbi:LysM peptidoglycan-binding domain-containing protein [Ottowia thiooxydans]|uniref:LysM peptidoglycan-binding domain-containing protein n=1 Tax=Ottowia thiooxydans TaxID=219182 RepID=UPI0012EB2DCE|nr:LysM domain-containing protein [Ottowia thiooxydans]